MNLKEVSALLGRSGVRTDVPRPLRKCYEVGDLRRLARRRVPLPVFDYVDGAADEEVALHSNRAAFLEWSFQPRHCIDVSQCDTSLELFGRSLGLPVVLSPTGFTRLLHPDGELAVARAARGAHVPYALSTMATTSIEQLAGTGLEDRWFQVYPLRSRTLTNEMLDRAKASGYEVLVICVDTPVLGKRIRDVRSGLTVPPRVTLGALMHIAARPGYWGQLLRGPALELANLGQAHDPNSVEILVEQFDPSLDWGRLEEIRGRWDGSILVKGLLGVEDATRAIELGADGIYLSNHGGRQLDRVVSPLHLIGPVREAIGANKSIVVDSGIQHGSDIALALALGADSAAIGRAYLFGLMAAGESGVAHVLKLLREQLMRTMQLLGSPNLDDLRANGARYLHKRRPRE